MSPEQEALNKRVAEATNRFIVCDGPRTALACSVGTSEPSDGVFVHVGEYEEYRAVNDTADEAINVFIELLKLDPTKLMLLWRVRPEIEAFENKNTGKVVWVVYGRMLMWGERE